MYPDDEAEATGGPAPNQGAAPEGQAGAGSSGSVPEGDGGAEDARSGSGPDEDARAASQPGEETVWPLGETLHMSPGAQSRGVPEEQPPARSLNEREVKVVNVFQLEEKEATFVLLQDGRGRRMPIWIGPHEAIAIYIALQKDQHNLHRPLTHDLLKNVIEKLDGKVERLTIDDIWQETYYARLVLNVGGRWVDIDCRPSDGIAIALRAQAPIYVAEEVLDTCKVGEE
ncbi:MAG: DUF151 domain-containing protein [Chloroflexi bacterium]|nr:DUF151 domain-containing protein [Chloroflexota bacterium]